MRTLNPRACSKAPIAAEAMPFPNEETTPPVIKMYFVIISLSCLVFWYHIGADGKVKLF